MNAIAKLSHQARSTRLLWVVMIVVLLAVAIAALCVGRYPLQVSHVIGILFSQLLPSDWLTWLGQWSDIETRVVMQVRLPRILMAILIGASLAMSGAVLQGIFRNPLVGPQILGISSGAAFGGCIAILVFSSLTAIMGMSFIGGLIAITAVYFLGRYQRQTSLLMLILAGVVISAFFAALVSLITYFADTNDTLPTIVFWLMGSLATATYVKLGVVVVPVVVGMTLLYLLRFRINVLSMGDEQAHAMGVAVEPLRWAILLCITFVVSASVAVSGTVGWVGLIMPHIGRMIVGDDHRVLLPVSAIIGAIYLLIVDTMARTLTSSEIPLSVITAVIGAPIFVWVMRRTQKKGIRHD